MPEASNTIAINQNPVIQWVTRYPDEIASQDSVYISAKAVDESAIALVRLT